MRYSILASGSTGNAFLIEAKKTRFLIDVGISARRVESALEAFGISLEALSGIWISHEHDDHVRGLYALLKKAPLPLYMNAATYAALKPKLPPVDVPVHIFPTGTRHRFYDLEVSTFAVSHDAVDPMMFRFTEVGGPSLVYLTDLGFVSERVKAAIEGAEAYVFEANHDVAMLRVGRYPWPLKRRILSDVGHLSNDDAAYALADVVHKTTRRIHLAHLSQENNVPEIARLSVVDILVRESVLSDADARVDVARPDAPSPLLSL
ncbi:MAG: MBL fold metallo-hydrolase [Hydrogenibacillus sp.]|nr:MBL fold metallo-hydrolase [Hydrogenibacillus sp.]